MCDDKSIKHLKEMRQLSGATNNVNSTDREKQVIRKMFKEPIDEVEKVFNDLTRAIEKSNRIARDYYVKRLTRKIKNLKAKLPTVQR